MNSSVHACTKWLKLSGAAFAAAAGALVVLAGCASAPTPLISASELPDDALFAAPAAPIDADRLFQLSAPMRRFADEVLASGKGASDRRRALLDALFRTDQLLLRYDASTTRDAAGTFATRRGNCLSLTVMTAAFARHLELPVTFQQVLVDDEYSRAGQMFFVSNHINVVIGRRAGTRLEPDADSMTVDFLPPSELRGQLAAPLAERTVRAMYLNNRAAELLAEGKPAEAYWWARAALAQESAFLAGANTLAVVYLQAGRPGHAERALRYVLERDPEHISAWSNLARTLAAAGRSDEAAMAARRLAELQPQPPFWHFDRGREAIERRDYAGARRLFERELRRQPNQHEVHFWLAQALLALDEPRLAQRHLKRAAESSPTPAQHALYGAKLERLKELTRTQ